MTIETNTYVGKTEAGFLTSILNFLQREEQTSTGKSSEAYQRLADLMVGAKIALALRACAEHKIADQLANGPLSADELADQLGPESPVDLYCATGSSGTQAGLMLGKALFRCDNWMVTGVPVCDDVGYFQREIRQLERATVSEFGLDVREEMTPINLLDGFIGPGYGIPYAEAIAVIRDCARYAGLLLDPVYTSKAMAGMLANIRSGSARRESIPVFVHTGGVFGLMARAELFDTATTGK